MDEISWNQVAKQLHETNLLPSSVILEVPHGHRYPYTFSSRPWYGNGKCSETFKNMVLNGIVAKHIATIKKFKKKMIARYENNFSKQLTQEFLCETEVGTMPGLY